jgi:hypothetical protein
MDVDVILVVVGPTKSSSLACRKALSFGVLYDLTLKFLHE